MTSFNWTDERCDELRKHWADGLSASQTAIAMGCGSRSAVIGKVHRLDLPARRTVKATPQGHPAASHQPKRKTVSKFTNFPTVRDADNPDPPLPAPVVNDDLIPVAQRITSVLALKECHCRWPVGDPGTPGFFFCGHPTADITVDRPYCRGHAKRARGLRQRYDGGERHHSFQVFNGKHT